MRKERHYIEGLPRSIYTSQCCKMRNDEILFTSGRIPGPAPHAGGGTIAYFQAMLHRGLGKRPPHPKSQKSHVKGVNYKAPHETQGLDSNES